MSKKKVYKIRITKDMIEKVKMLSHPKEDYKSIYNFLVKEKIINDNIFSFITFKTDMTAHNNYMLGNTSIYKEDDEFHVLKRQFYSSVSFLRDNSESEFITKMVNDSRKDDKGHITIKVYEKLFENNSNKISIESTVGIKHSLADLIVMNKVTINSGDDIEL